MRAGKMAAAAVPLRGLGRLCRVLLFLSQFYVLSGGGELDSAGHAGSGGAAGGTATCEKRLGWARSGRAEDGG